MAASEPSPKMCLQVKWYLENVLNFLDHTRDAVTEDTMDMEDALAAVQQAEDPAYQSVGVWERMLTWADVAREAVYPALTAALPRARDAWWSREDAEEVLHKHGIEDTGMLRALVAILEHNLLSRQRGSVPVMIPSKDAPDDEICALLSFAALGSRVLRSHRGGSQEKDWCRRVTSALDIYRVADGWKWDNYQYAGCVIVLARMVRMFCDEMLSHRNLRKVVLKLTRVIPRFMVDKVAEAAESRVARLAEAHLAAQESNTAAEYWRLRDKIADLTEEACSALATIFSLPDTGYGHGTVTMLRERWSLWDLIEEVRTSSEDGEGRRLLPLVCELISARLPQAAPFVWEVAGLKTSELESLVRDTHGAGVRLLLAALSVRVRSVNSDNARNDLVTKLLAVLRSAASVDSNSVAWWLGLGSPHWHWGLKEAWTWWWQRETPHPQTLRQQLGRSLREAWLVPEVQLNLGSSERLEEEELLRSPSAPLDDRQWESAEEDAETPEGGQLVPAQSEEPWPSFEDEGEECCLAVEKAVLYAQAQEQWNQMAFRVVCQRSMVPPEEEPRMGWAALKSGRELLLLGPPQGELLADVPAVRSVQRQAALSDVVTQTPSLQDAQEEDESSEQWGAGLQWAAVVVLPYCSPPCASPWTNSSWDTEAQMDAASSWGASPWLGSDDGNGQPQAGGGSWDAGQPNVEAQAWQPVEVQACVADTRAQRREGIYTPTSSDDELLTLDAQELMTRRCLSVDLSTEDD